MQKPPTIGDVARAAGVHHSTASRALSNHAHIKASTREHVLACAAQLGYRPDPVLRALSKYRWKDPEQRVPGTGIALIVAQGASQIPEQLQAATQEAEALGFRLSLFARKDFPNDAALERLLISRGIEAVLLHEEQPGHAPPEFDWSRLIAVAIGHPPDRPPFLDTVMPDIFSLHHQAIKAIWTAGYRRPGLVLHPPRFMANEALRIGGAEAAWQSLPNGRRRLPILWWRSSDQKPLTDWVEKAKLDVVLGQSTSAYEALLSAGWRMPEDIGFFAINRMSNQAEISGVGPDQAEVGRQAVRLLAGKLNQRRFGCPEKPMTHITAGKAYEGKTSRGYEVA